MPLFCLALLLRDIDLAKLEALAQARDSEGLLAFSSFDKLNNPFRFLKTGGAYGTGRFGWHVLPLDDLDGVTKYVVFTTKITSEDLGEQVFEIENGKLSRHVRETETFGFRFKYHNFALRFDLPAKKAMLVDRATISGKGKRLVFRLSPQYRVSSILDARDKVVQFHQAGGIVLATAPLKTPTFYTIRYTGVVDLPGFAGGISDREASLTNDYWWPMIARLPASHSIAIHAPKDWTAIGQGELTGITETATEKVTHYRMDLPVSYLSVSCGKYTEGSTTIGGRKFSIWALDGDPKDLALRCEFYAPILRFYEHFAPYPFSRWGALASPVYGGGALEAYSYATYGEIPGEDPHEPAHTWWGGIIPCTYLGSMWNESFADFCEGLFRREGAAGNREERRLAFISDAHASAVYRAATCAEASAEIGPAASALGYGKGAQVLQMLEAEIGTDAMMTSMKVWIAMHKKGEAGDWAEFETAVEKAVGKDMKGFFDQWIRRTGWPEFVIDHVSWAGGEVTGEIKFDGPPYRLKLEVLLVDADGKRSLTTIEVGAGDKFSCPCAIKPVLVSFDPWRRILRTIHPDENPLYLGSAINQMQPWVAVGLEASAKQMLSHRQTEASSEMPPDLDGRIVVGSPNHPRIKALAEKVGFRIEGDKLTYDGTTIDLATEGALALVDLEGGKHCVIAFGNPSFSPNPGRSRLCLVDRLGRFIRGKTEPKTSGWLTFRL